MERRQHNSGKQKPGFAFRMGQGAGDGVFEYFGQRRKRGAQYRSHEPEIPKQSCFNHGIDFSIKAHGAVIHHAKDGGANLQILGVYDAVGDGKSGGAFAGAAFAQAGIDVIQHL